MTVARAPIDRADVWARLDHGFVTSLTVVDEVGSTNAELLRAVASGAPAGTVLVAELQTAGRGRFDRVWTSAVGAGLTFSIVLRPTGVPARRWPWLPLLAGVSLRAGLLDVLRPRSVEAGAVVLKWPNDVLLGPDRAKVAGILAEVNHGAVVLGMGVNVHHRPGELPGAAATSLDLALPGPAVARADVLVSVLAALAQRYTRWTGHAGDPVASGLRREYEDACDTLGRPVEVDQNGVSVAGTATGLDDTGALIVETGAGIRAISAGDVTHVRAHRR